MSVPRLPTNSTTNLTRLFDDCDENINIRNYNKNVLEELTVDLLRLPKMEIITRWLKGEQRDKIASAMGLGAGTISAIISEWKAEIGIPNANTLRQFSTELRNVHTNPVQSRPNYLQLTTFRKDSWSYRPK